MRHQVVVSCELTFNLDTPDEAGESSAVVPRAIWVARDIKDWFASLPQHTVMGSDEQPTTLAEDGFISVTTPSGVEYSVSYNVRTRQPGRGSVTQPDGGSQHISWEQRE